MRTERPSRGRAVVARVLAPLAASLLVAAWLAGWGWGERLSAPRRVTVYPPADPAGAVGLARACRTWLGGGVVALFCGSPPAGGAGQVALKISGPTLISSGTLRGIAQALGPPLEDDQRLEVRSGREAQGELVVRGLDGEWLITARFADLHLRPGQRATISFERIGGAPALVLRAAGDRARSADVQAFSKVPYGPLPGPVAANQRASCEGGGATQATDRDDDVVLYQTKRVTPGHPEVDLRKVKLSTTARLLCIEYTTTAAPRPLSNFVVTLYDSSAELGTVRCVDIGAGRAPDAWHLQAAQPGEDHWSEGFIPGTVHVSGSITTVGISRARLPAWVRTAPQLDWRAYAGTTKVFYQLVDDVPNPRESIRHPDGALVRAPKPYQRCP